MNEVITGEVTKPGKVNNPGSDLEEHNARPLTNLTTFGFSGNKAKLNLKFCRQYKNWQWRQNENYATFRTCAIDPLAIYMHSSSWHTKTTLT